MGRTSTINEIANRLASEHKVLPVRLVLVDEDLNTSDLIKALLTAAVETLADDTRAEPWYLAWCNRVHLRDQGLMSEVDHLVSALAFAADPHAILQPAVIRRDLETLHAKAIARGYEKIVVVLDDADALFEDDDLTQRLIANLDSTAGAWSLLTSTMNTGLKHLIDGISPSLQRLEIVPIAPFWSFGQIWNCLAGPLEPAQVKAITPPQFDGLLADLRRLSSGSPFVIALFARQLWQACELGEQDYYQLTPRILERGLAELAIYTGGDDLRPSPVASLSPDRLRSALRLVSLSRLTARQIAIADALGVPNDDQAIDIGFGGHDLGEDTRRIVEKLEELEDDGIVTLEADRETFTVRGGDPIGVALKYHARALFGVDGTNQPFGIPFLTCVGEPIANYYVKQAREQIEGARVLAQHSIHSRTSTGAGARIRSAIDARRFDTMDLGLGSDAAVLPYSVSLFEEMETLVLPGSELAVALVDITIVADDRDLDWVELWQIPSSANQHVVNEALSDSLVGAESLLETAGLTWRGTLTTVLQGDEARRFLIQLVPPLASGAVATLFNEWRSGSGPGLQAAIDLARETVAVLRAHEVPDWQRGGDESEMLSRLGFLLSFDDDVLDEADQHLERAQKYGTGDGPVTTWNRMNIQARKGDRKAALELLQRFAGESDGYKHKPIAILFIPGRAPCDNIIELDLDSAGAIVDVQRIILESGKSDSAALYSALEALPADGEISRLVKEWLQEA